MRGEGEKSSRRAEREIIEENQKIGSLVMKSFPMVGHFICKYIHDMLFNLAQG